MVRLKESDKPTKTYRLIRRLRDGAVKKQEPIMAARMVAKGGYAYADDGPDESKLAPKTKKFRRASDEPADVISLSRVKELDVSGEGEQYTGPRRSIRTDVVMTETSTEPTFEPKADRKVTKKSDIPKAKMDYIIQTNVASPAVASADKNAGSLKEVIDKVRSQRK